MAAQKAEPRQAGELRHQKCVGSVTLQRSASLPITLGGSTNTSLRFLTNDSRVVEICFIIIWRCLCLPASFTVKNKAVDSFVLVGCRSQSFDVMGVHALPYGARRPGRAEVAEAPWPARQAGE